MKVNTPYLDQNRIFSPFFRKIIIASLCCISELFFAQDRYVSALLGSDVNSGLSVSEPLRTIKKGLTQIYPGDTLFVMNGTYQNEGYGTVDVAARLNMNNPHVVNINKSGTKNAYPNPTSDQVTILGLNFVENISVYDIHGKRQLFVNVPKIETERVVLDTRDLKSGLYFIKISIGSEHKVIKLMVR